jgi:two-component sensor histidine kinase
MAIEKSIHSINNKLGLILSRAELLCLGAKDKQTKDQCEEIKQAVLRISSLMQLLATQDEYSNNVEGAKKGPGENYESGKDYKPVHCSV